MTVNARRGLQVCTRTCKYGKNAMTFDNILKLTDFLDYFQISRFACFPGYVETPVNL